MPPLPKYQPARRNKSTTKSTLRLVHDVQAPELPDSDDREWHEQTRAWWVDVWASPMAPEYHESDRHGLFLLAVLIDNFWRRPGWQTAAEIRLQRQGFGLTPLDRRRLQWEIEKVEEAQARGRARRSTARRAPADPLAALEAM